MFTEGRYTEVELRRNRRGIGLTAAGAVAVCLVCGALTSWAWTNAIATAALVVGFAACFWWMFASRKAGPLRVHGGSWKRLRDTFGMR